MHPVDIEDLERIRPVGGCVATVGNFDGVHRGHRRLVEAVAERALRRGVSSVAVDFEPHTRHFLDPAGGPQLLSTWTERELLLREAGIDKPVTIRFDDAVRRLDPEAFVDRLVDGLGAVELVLGFDNRFGRGASGTAEGITSHCRERGIPLSVVGPLEQEGAPVSSTRIRSRLVDFDGFAEALELLGHPWTLLGEVVHGDGRGRQIGFPTANLEPVSPRKLLPGSGVYAGLLSWEGGHRHPAAVNIGSAPTFARGTRVVEVHVPGGPGPDYGQICRLDLYFPLRKESRFESLEALRDQIGRDAETARKRILQLP